jgi:hypothetical protein
MLLVTFLASLFNTVALLYWQHANEQRLDIHYETLRKHQAWIKQLLPMLNLVSVQLRAWEAWRDALLASAETKPPESP